MGPKGLQEQDGIAQALARALSSSICPLSMQMPLPALRDCGDTGSPWAQLSLPSRPAPHPGCSQQTRQWQWPWQQPYPPSSKEVARRWCCSENATLWHFSLFPRVSSLASWGSFSLAVSYFKN